MTASLVGQVGPGQRPASRRRRESSEGRLGPLLNQQPTPTIQPNPPPTSAVRGWPHWWTAKLSASIATRKGRSSSLSSESWRTSKPHSPN